MFNRTHQGLWWDEGLSLVEGCTPVNCTSCWSAQSTAMRQYNPLKSIKTRYEGLIAQETDIDGSPQFNGVVRIMANGLSRPLTRKIPTVYAVWNDLFHEQVPYTFVNDFFNIATLCQHHVFIVLTQRVDRARLLMEEIYSGRGGKSGVLDNVAIGTTVRCKEDIPRIAKLSKILASARVLSIEPLLEDISDELQNTLSSNFIHGVFLGAATGKNKRIMYYQWAREIKNICVHRSIPFFFKSWGNSQPIAGEKGRKLDGREWNQLPKIPSLFKTFYFTFGYDQKPYGIGYYTTVKAYDMFDARERIHQVYGRNWSFAYTSAEEAGVKEYGLTHIVTK